MDVNLGFKVETGNRSAYTVDQIVEAHRYVDSGRKKGNIVGWERIR